MKTIILFPDLVLKDPIWTYDFVKQMFPHVSVHRAQRVVQNINVFVLVNRSRQTDPLLLASA